MKKTMVNDVVTKNVKVVPPDSTVLEAASVMKEAGVGALPVVDGDKVVGIVTDRDIVLRVVAEEKQPEETKVREAMTAGVLACNASDTVDEAAQIMRSNQVRRLLVRDSVSGGALGVVSLGDIALGATAQIAGKAIRDVSREKVSEDDLALPVVK